jgi:hypothetical protein
MLSSMFCISLGFHATSPKETQRLFRNIASYPFWPRQEATVFVSAG